MRKKESRENKELTSGYHYDYPPQQRPYPREEQYPRNRSERTEKIPPQHEKIPPQQRSYPRQEQYPRNRTEKIPPQREKGTYYRSEYPEFPSQQQHKRSLFSLYLIGIISVIFILSAGMLLIFLLPHHKKTPTAQQVVTITSIEKIPTTTHIRKTIPHTAKPTQHINQVPTPQNTTPPNNCPTNINGKIYTYGNTILMQESITGNLNRLQMLISCGANVNERNNNQVTALMIASANGRTDVVKLLLQHGAEINASDINGGTPLMFAAEHDRLEVVRLLLDRGANVNAKDNYGGTALTAAHNAYVIDLLRSRGGK